MCSTRSLSISSSAACTAYADASRPVWRYERMSVGVVARTSPTWPSNVYSAGTASVWISVGGVSTVACFCASCRSASTYRDVGSIVGSPSLGTPQTVTATAMVVYVSARPFPSCRPPCPPTPTDAKGACPRWSQMTCRLNCLRRSRASLCSRIQIRRCATCASTGRVLPSRASMPLAAVCRMRIRLCTMRLTLRTWKAMPLLPCSRRGVARST